MAEKIRVLILCTGNSARSQMAEGLLRHQTGDAFLVQSAGLEPSFVRPEAIEVMHELGIDISGYRSKSLEGFTEQSFDYVITVCDNANQNCPIFPGAGSRIHWSVADPGTVTGTQQIRLAAFRFAREDLRRRLDKFVENVKETVGEV